MSAETLRGLIRADPFHPFTLQLDNGRRIRVQHRNFITVSGNGQSFTIFDGAGPCDTMEMTSVSSCDLDGKSVT